MVHDPLFFYCNLDHLSDCFRWLHWIPTFLCLKTEVLAVGILVHALLLLELAF